jgi:hypothetical protein
MGDHADDALFAGLDQSWGWRQYFTPAPKPKNAQVFAHFAGNATDFKAGQRVVHKPSDVAGVVVTVRGSQVAWRPDTRLTPGAVWVDSDKLRFDI